MEKNSEEFKEKIIKEYLELESIGYNIEEIINYLSQKYNLPSNQIKEIIDEKLTILYPIVKKINNFFLFGSFISFILISLITNNIPLAIIILITLIYGVTIMDYFVINNRINYKLALFFISLIFSFVFLISFGFLNNEQFLIPISIFLSFLLTIYSFVTNKIKSFQQIFQNFYIFILYYFSFLLCLLLIFFLINEIFNKILPFFIVNFIVIILSLIIGRLILSTKFIKDKSIKKFTFIIEITVILFFFYAVMSSSSSVFSKSIDNFASIYNLQKVNNEYSIKPIDLVKSEIGFFNCGEIINKDFKVFIQLLSSNQKNNNETIKIQKNYLKVLYNFLIKKNCIEPHQYFEYDSLFQLLTSNLLKNTKCYNQIKESMQKKDIKFREILKNKSVNMSKKDLGYYINLVYVINNINKCQNQKQSKISNLLIFT